MKVSDGPSALFWNGQDFLLYLLEKANLLFKLNNNCMAQKCWKNENVFSFGIWFEGHKQSDNHRKILRNMHNSKSTEKDAGF